MTITDTHNFRRVETESEHSPRLGTTPAADPAVEHSQRFLDAMRRLSILRMARERPVQTACVASGAIMTTASILIAAHSYPGLGTDFNLACDLLVSGRLAGHGVVPWARELVGLPKRQANEAKAAPHQA